MFNISDSVVSYFLFSLLLIIGFVNAQDSAEASWQQHVPAWFPLFAIAAIIGYGLVGVAFMLSKVFQLPQLETWARLELFEVTGSAFLVLIVLISLGVIDNLFVATVNKTPMNISLDFTSSVSNELLKRYIDTVQLGAAIGLLSGPPVQYLDATASESGKSGETSGNAGSGPDGAGGNNAKIENSNRVFMVALKNLRLNFLTFYAADIFNGHFNLIQSVALTSLGISIFSNVLLTFVNAIAIPILIPLGLFLSIFSLTRKMGRTLIAFGVGLYLFVPLSILVTQIMYESAFKPGAAIPEISMPSGSNDVDSFIRGIFALNITELLLRLTLATIGIIQAGGPALVPSCVTGSVATASICGIAQPVCAVAFTVICTFLGGFSDVGQSNDLLNNFQTGISVLRILWLGEILDVNVLDQITGVAATYIGIAIVGLGTAPLFHLIAGQALTINYIQPILNNLLSLGTYSASVLTATAYANLNQHLAIKLTNITLAYLPYVLQYVVPIMLLPFIMLVIVVTGIRSISPAIGGEIQILGVSELI